MIRWTLAAAGIVVGLAVLQGCDWAKSAPAKTASLLVPKAVVDQEEYQFGTMVIGTKKSHTFVIKNAGTAPLTLEKLETTCKCTLSKFPDNSKVLTLVPGQSTDVTLEWEARMGSPGTFRQSATIGTNDPAKESISLTVMGMVYEQVQPDPGQIVFSDLDQFHPTEGSIKVWAMQADDLAITGHKFANPEMAQFFEVTSQPVPPDKVKAGERSGVEVKVRVKPGLPLGPLRQKLTLETNQPGRPTLEIPISGTVSGDVSIVGKGYDAEAGLLRLGVVESSRGFSRTLKLITRGPHRSDVIYRVAKVTSPGLKVSLGSKSDINASATQVPLVFEVDKGTTPEDHLGNEQGHLAEVLLETSLPNVKEIKLQVQFAIAG